MIRLQKPVARLVIKDLITGDGVKKEVVLLNGKVILLKQKIVLKDSIISQHQKKENNFQNLLATREEQLTLARELNTKLETSLKRQKLKNKLTLGGAAVVALGILLLK